MADKTPLIERVLLNLMGPASIGDLDAPVREVDLPPEICPACDRPRSSHPVTRDPLLGSVSECPGRG